MKKMKAVVLEKSGSRYTVLDQNGTFRQVHRRLNAEVGEEVQIQPWTECFSEVRIWAGAVALFLLALTTLLGWTLYQAPTAVALLSVDINPSLQFAVDSQGHLLKFQTQNEDAKRMLSQINLKGKPIEEVLEQIVTQAYDQEFLGNEQHWVVVGYSPMTNITLEQMPEELNEIQIISWVTETGKKKGLTPQVAVFPLTSQERELAQEGDLTLGEYALWQTADKAGVLTQPEKLKDTSERVQLLENPQVQVQIKADKNKRQSDLPQTSGTWKQNSGSIGIPGKYGAEKHLPEGKRFSPSKDLFPSIDKSRSRKDEDKDMKKDQDKDNDILKEQDTNNANNNAKDKDMKKVKDQEEYQNKDKNNDKNKDKNIDKNIDQNKAKISENKAKISEIKVTQQTKYVNINVPPIPTPENSRRDISRTNNSPENYRDKQQKR